MARYLSQFALNGVSGLPEDVMVNTMAFESNSGAPDNGEMNAITAAIAAFYSELTPAFATALPDTYALKLYDIDAPEPRVPLRSLTASLVGAGSGGARLPEEVAVCLSYNGVGVSGSPAARRRGRVYIGHLGVNALATNARPSSNWNAWFLDAITEFLAELDGSGVIHSVWSRADDELYNVVRYTMDDAFDTQRRRGQAPTTRTTIWDV